MTQITPDMNKKEIKIIGIILAYLTIAGIENTWYILTDLETKESVKRIFAGIFLSLLFSYLIYKICMMFDIYDD